MISSRVPTTPSGGNTEVEKVVHHGGLLRNWVVSVDISQISHGAKMVHDWTVKRIPDLLKEIHWVKYFHTFLTIVSLDKKSH